ncbi:hypothetical protein SVI_2730 [Shewanella violacea DSS12]|uniref:Uncharacterized protein n=1 Tax=Shewanella violacea (strain JCM 10179 / CIP 106290 / LMG 19151 / DSS12) TaxID=637905 RepID=D4ZM02_SHEVD|nr:hypothetical protein SVI_2730 [Shewanella violacea DSS12]
MLNNIKHLSLELISGVIDKFASGIDTFHFQEALS